MRIVPPKRADTGPMREATIAFHVVSSMRSSDSHPGTHSLRIAGSFSAAHTLSGGAGTILVLVSCTRPPERDVTLHHDHRLPRPLYDGAQRLARLPQGA